MNRKTGIAIGVLLLLLVAYLMLREDRVRVGMHELELASFQPSQVDALDVTGTNPVHLVKENGHWVVVMQVEGQPAKKVAADDKAVEQMLQAASQVKAGYFVSSLPEKYSEFEVGDTQGSRVQLKSKNKVVWDVLIGNYAKGGRYIRALPSADVYVASGRFNQIVKGNASDWRRHEIVGVSPDDMRRLVLKDPVAGEVVLERTDKEKEWVLVDNPALPKGFRYDKKKAAQLARTFALLRASQFIDDPAKEQPVFDPAHTVVGTDDKNKTYTINLAAKNSDGKAPAQLVGDPQLYEVPGYIATQLGGGLESVRDMSLFQFDPKNAQMLMMRAPRAQVKLEKKEGKWHIVQPAVLPAGYVFDEERVVDFISRLRDKHAMRLGTAHQAVLAKAGPYEVELIDDKGQKYTLHMSKPLPKVDKAAPDEVAAISSIDGNVYVLNGYDAKDLEEGVKLFEKTTPPQGGGVQGMESLPPEVQRQLMKAMQQRGG